MKKTFAVLVLLAACNAQAGDRFNCTATTYDIVGGSPVERYTGDPGVVVDMGHVYAINVLTSNLTSPALKTVLNKKTGNYVSEAHTEDYDFYRVVDDKTNEREYTLVKINNLRMYKLNQCVLVN